MIKKLIAFIFAYGTIYGAVSSHGKMEERLRETWKKSWPVEFTRIVKSDITGRGVLYYNQKDKRVYIYTYIVYVPKFRVKKGELAINEKEGRNVTVRLFYSPEDEGLEIKTGRFTEQHNRRNIIRWIK